MRVGLKEVYLDFGTSINQQLTQAGAVESDTSTRGFIVTGIKGIDDLTNANLRLVARSEFMDIARYSEGRYDAETGHIIIMIPDEAISRAGRFYLQFELVEGTSRIATDTVTGYASHYLAQGNEALGTVSYVVLQSQLDGAMASLDSSKAKLTEYQQELQDIRLAESERLLSETQRNNAESERETKEDLRQGAESLRVDQEQERQRQEGIRQSQESGRVQAEAERKDAEALREEKTPKDLQSQILWRNKSYLLHDFQTDIVANYGTVEYDTTVKYSGDRSLKLTTNAVNKYATARVDLGVGGIDLSNSHLMMMCRTGHTLANIRLQLWGNAFENLGHYDRSNGGALTRSKDNWQLNTFSGGAGNVITQNVRYIDITASVAGDIPATVYFNQLRRFDKPETGYVTITLDGAYKEQYTQLKPLLDAKDYKACLMVSDPTYIENGSLAYMTKAEIKDCENVGWDIANHSGFLLTGLTEQELKDLAKSKKDWLKVNGYSNRGARFLCALQNQWNQLAGDVMGDYFHFLRTGYGITMQSAIQNTTLPIFNPRCIQDVASNASYAQQLALVEAAARHKQWVVLTWHQPNRPGELTLTEMEDMLNAIKSLGLEVVTFSDVADDILRLK